MVCCCTVIALFAGLALLFKKILNFFRVPPVPQIEEKWWGSGRLDQDENVIEPFKIDISDEILRDLKQRLDNALPFQKPINDSAQTYGMNTNLLNTIVDYWKTKYDWKEREKFLNQYPQFRTNVQGLKIHYLHVKPTNTEGLKVLPLLLIHGWPGTVREFYEMIPLLTTPQPDRDFVFEVVAPSLPGFGFSEATDKKGLGPVHMAVIFKNLMKKLGYKNYYIQGGDWGAIIVHHMSILFPGYITGVLSNMPLSMMPISMIKMTIVNFIPSLILTEEERRYADRFSMKRLNHFRTAESGYNHLQGTKPDTVGVALRESPVGLAAYILEKFTTWTNPDWINKEDGGLTIKYTFDKLLDNLMIYWVTRSITTSVRIYYENLNRDPEFELLKIPVNYVPSGCARYTNDIMCMPESVLKDKFKKLVYVSCREAGHFAAFEEPTLLAEDIFKFVQIVENSKN